MVHIELITGGARSGKSSYAQQMAEALSKNPVYLATARIWDDDFKKRIERHKSDRGPHWTTIEEEISIHKTEIEERVVVLDCITLWLTNIFYKNNYDLNSSLEQAKAEWELFTQKNMTVFVVSNELGMGIHPENESARKFADLQGWMNQYIAKSAQKVTLMVAGLPLSVK